MEKIRFFAIVHLHEYNTNFDNDRLFRYELKSKTFWPMHYNFTYEM